MRTAGDGLRLLWRAAASLIPISVLGCTSYPVSILSHYGSTVSYLGYPYPGAPYHEGVDIAGEVGDPILAVLGGGVIAVGKNAGDDRCGLGVLSMIGDLAGGVSGTAIYQLSQSKSATK